MIKKIPFLISISTIIGILSFISFLPSFISDSRNVKVLAAQSTEESEPVELLPQPLILAGNKEVTIRKVSLRPDILNDKSALTLTVDLHGLCLSTDSAGVIEFEQLRSNRKNKILLKKYLIDCQEGLQTTTIPLNDFGIRSNTRVAAFVAKFWYPTNYNVEITSATVANNVLGTSSSPLTQSPLYRTRRRHPTQTPTPLLTPTPSTSIPTVSPTLTPPFSPTPTLQLSITPSPTRTGSTTPTIRLTLSPSPTRTSTIAPTRTLSPTATRTPTISPTRTPTPTISNSGTPTPTLSTQQTWSIQSVSSMKESKDRVCDQRAQTFIDQWVTTAANLGVNYIAVETPYDSPGCGNSVTYTQHWVQAIHSRGLHVWHRHMPLAFEGIYNTPKNLNIDYLQQIANYIRANPTFFRDGDIFTPIPEPQNGGIQGVTYCSRSICIFQNPAQFNQWLRNAMSTSETAFQQIGLGGKIKIGYFGFDGFVAWGDNNPDWHGILEDTTIAQMGNITIDHYPELVGDTMSNDLNELQTRYPNVPIVIGEWGTVADGNPMQQVQNSMGAARRSNVVGFNYWHMGIGGNEGLINEDFSLNPQYSTVQTFFRP